MQDAHNTAGATGSGGELPSSRVPLGTIALALLVAAGIIAGFIIFTRDSGAPDAPPVTEGGEFRLTDEEAIDRYLELEQLIVQTYEGLDPSLTSSIYTPESKIVGLVHDELRDLRQDDLSVSLAFRPEKLNVLANSANIIKLREIVMVDVDFINQKGVDVADPAEAQLQVVDIEMRRVGDTWLIHDSEILRSGPARGGE